MSCIFRITTSDSEARSQSLSPLRCSIFTYVCLLREGRDSSVGVGTRYGLDGPGIKSQWGARFSAPV